MPDSQSYKDCRLRGQVALMSAKEAAEPPKERKMKASQIIYKGLFDSYRPCGLKPKGEIYTT